MSNKKKVLILTTVLAPYRVDLFNEIVKDKSIDLTVCFEQLNDKIRNNEWYSHDSKFNCVILNGAEKSLKKIKFSFFDFLKDKSFDLVFFYEPSTFTASLAIRYCIFNKIKYFLNCDGAFISKHENILKKIIKTENIKNASGLIGNGKSAEKYYLNYSANKDIIFNHHFSNLSNKDILKVPNSISEKKKYKDNLNLNYDFVFLSVGNFIHLKGFDLFLNSIKLFNAKNNLDLKVGFIIIGSGDFKEEYLKFISDNNLSNVEIIDFVPKSKLLKYYDASDCFCLFTRNDVWGLVIHEAMARGLPVISTNKCNASLELILNENCGEIINLDNDYENIIDDICQSMLKILSKYEKIDFNAILKIASEYTIEVSAKEHLNAINYVLEK